MIPIAGSDLPLLPGTVLWFEYHCNESHKSADAQLWYRSQQQVTVLSCTNDDMHGDLSQLERFETGHQLVYRIRFADGFEGAAFEDELLASSAGFQRPAPPLPQEHA